MASWVPLHVHSQYSILDAAASVKGLANTAAELGLPAIALTDHGNLFGVVDFFKACQGAGVKPIMGCELNLAPTCRTEKKRIPGHPVSYQFVVLAENDEGYHNLCKLSSIGYLEGFYYRPRVDREVIEKYSKGLICLTGLSPSRLGTLVGQEDQEGVREELQWLKNFFGDRLYLQLQRASMTDHEIAADEMQRESWVYQNYLDYKKRLEACEKGILKLAQENALPYVATSDLHYLQRQDWKAHEILLNVQSGEPCEIWEKDSLGNNKCRVPNPKRKTYPSHDYHFKSPDEMAELFADLPEALERTLEVAERCNAQLDFKTKHYPIYVPPSLEGGEFSEEQQKQEVERFLRELCTEGIKKRYTADRLAKVQEKYPDQDPLQVVRERLDSEMSIIASKGMCDYLLIVWDFIDWAKRHGIPVGPGRGSGAGSIILYLIGITDIEPLRFNLFFERFINPERLSYPDIDVDICMHNRGRVIDYTLNKYGEENVAQIVTFGTMKAKMAIKDVGRVLNVPLSKVNAICKLIPDDLNMTIEKALELDQDLRQMSDEDEEAGRVIEYALRLEGSIRNTGIHAAGIIICGDPLTEHIPVFRPKEAEMAATQYSMKPVEAVGMLKVDFLGLKTLTSIQMCVNALKQYAKVDVNWMDLPLDDEATFSLLNQGKTSGVFQLESPGMQELARQLHLDKFEEIIAVVSLYRPGPMDMIPSFINRKHGREPIEFDHPWMEDILDETYGIMVYQEQVMQIACKLANFSLGEGDVLRRAMGKKDMEQMAQQRVKFRDGAKVNGIGEETAMLIFDRMEKFAAYGFNKSHAAAYGYLSYVTAYLKANHPREWMAALMTCDRDDVTKVAKFIRECQSMGIPILPPDVNEAGTEFVATSQGIRFAINGIKGVGEGVVESIIAEREKNGPFEDFYQFFQRVDLKRVGKKVVQNLVDAGSFDFTGWTRDQLRENIDEMFDVAQKEKKDEATGVISLFSLMGEDSKQRFSEPPAVKQETPPNAIYLKEKELLGFFLTGHPLDSYDTILNRLSCVPFNRINELDNQSVFRAAFIIDTVNVRISARSQKKFAILTVGDGMERYELPVWPELFEEKAHLLNENQLLYAVLSIEKSDAGIKLSCHWLDDLSCANEAMVEACDRAFDKAKLQRQRQAYLKARNEQDRKKNQQEAARKPEETVSQHFSLEVDAHKCRLSQVLAIKKIFRKHRGNTPVTMQFKTGDFEVAQVNIDSRWGVNTSAQLEQEIRELECVIS